MFMILTEGVDVGATITLPADRTKYAARKYLKIALDHYDQTMKHEDFVKAALQLKAFANSVTGPFISVRFSRHGT